MLDINKIILENEELKSIVNRQSQTISEYIQDMETAYGCNVELQNQATNLLKSEDKLKEQLEDSYAYEMRSKKIISTQKQEIAKLNKLVNINKSTETLLLGKIRQLQEELELNKLLNRKTVDTGSAEVCTDIKQEAIDKVETVSKKIAPREAQRVTEKAIINIYV